MVIITCFKDRELCFEEFLDTDVNESCHYSSAQSYDPHQCPSHQLHVYVRLWRRGGG